MSGNLSPDPCRIAWDDLHMLQAILTSYRSPDPNTKVGACIVNEFNQTIGTGYNAFPTGIAQTQFTWERDNPDPLCTKYPYVIHAEKNAIYNTGDLATIKGSSIYVTLYCCNECAKDIIQAGIKEVIWLTNPYAGTWQTVAAERLFLAAGVQTREHKWRDDPKLWLGRTGDLVGKLHRDP